MLRPHPLAWKLFWWLLIALRIWIQMLNVNFKILYDQTPALPHKASSHSTSACLLTNLHLDCSPSVHSTPSSWDAFSVLPIPHPTHPSTSAYSWQVQVSTQGLLPQRNLTFFPWLQQALMWWANMTLHTFLLWHLIMVIISPLFLCLLL